MRRNDFFKYLIFGGGGSASRSELESETLPYTFNSNSYKLRNYRIYGNTVDGESVGDLVTEGEHIGEYCVPVSINQSTINLYLPKTLRKFGNNSDYIDYSEQKMHRIKTNLFDGTFIHRSVIGAVVGDDDPNRRSVVIDISSFANGNKITFSRETGVGSILQMYQVSSPLTGGNLLGTNLVSGNSETLLATITLNNISNYPYLMVFLNGATDPITDEELLASKIMINVGGTALPYEAYNAATEITVNLPKLSTFSGVNTLSIDSNVPPSKIWIQGNISEIETVSVQALQANMQSLQPLSFDDEDLEIDVMQTDNDLQLDVKPIEKPVLNLNDVSEIENAEIERGVESAE